ncbi:hypothetical protein [Vulcanisaeta thermophila]|uniref:hypothetical protein n=1 Tax=Vulcanisaeta thermophila TaxID=867917 RepID=UPI0008537620|nr:hypothetical protein [Vulcanisaeta thermophila]
MIGLVIGRQDLLIIKRGFTFKSIDGINKLGFIPDVELSPLSAAIMLRIAELLNERITPPLNNVRLSEYTEDCNIGSFICMGLKMLRYGDADLDKLRDSINSIPLPTIEPVSTMVGIILSIETGLPIEVYSDIWPMLVDVLAEVKGLGRDVVVHSNVFDINRVYVFDYVIRRFIRIPRIDDVYRHEEGGDDTVELIDKSFRRDTRAFSKYSTAAPARFIEPPKGLVHLLKVLIGELNGVTTLKSLTDILSRDGFGLGDIMSAVDNGYVTYNPMDLTVRVTPAGLAMARHLGIITSTGDANAQG